MIKQILENAISNIESNRQREAEIAKQTVIREKVVPFNAEIDTSLREAMNELQAKHNEKIAQMQQALEAEKTILTEAATQKKAEFSEQQIESAVALINAQADAAIQNLKKMIDSQGA